MRVLRTFWLTALAVVLVATTLLPAQADDSEPTCKPDGRRAEMIKCLAYPPTEYLLQIPGYLAEIVRTDSIYSNPGAAATLAAFGDQLPEVSGSRFAWWRQVYGTERLQKMMQYRAVMHEMGKQLGDFLVATRRADRRSIPLPPYNGEPAGTKVVPPNTPAGWSLVASLAVAPPTRPEWERDGAETSWNREPFRRAPQPQPGWAWQFSLVEAYQGFISLPAPGNQYLGAVLGAAPTELPGPDGGTLNFTGPGGKYAIAVGAGGASPVKLGNPQAKIADFNATKADWAEWEGWKFKFDPVVGPVTFADNRRLGMKEKWKRCRGSWKECWVRIVNKF